MNYHFKIHRARPGYWAECLELQGCLTQGDTMEELRANMRELLNLFLDEPATSTVVFPLPAETMAGKNICAVEVEPDIAFATMLRSMRAARSMTQSEAARKLGMNNVYSYQRLERKSNPTLVMLKKIKAVFPELDIGSLI
jgi:predicted RNase H-like HicB family nuclease